MQIESRDGKFIISADDKCKTGCTNMGPGDTEETKFDKENDVYLQVKEGVTASLNELADTIFCDCFSRDSCGLRLLSKKLNCYVVAGNKTYNFTVNEQSCLDFILDEIADQLIL